MYVITYIFFSFLIFVTRLKIALLTYQWRKENRTINDAGTTFQLHGVEKLSTNLLYVKNETENMRKYSWMFYNFMYGFFPRRQ
jgi:hypothetical protein